ncbi:MAG: Ig-like domain-containing protein [Prevotella sp.]|nr:Ig-like domain-containing protein [Prevotella sp.]
MERKGICKNVGACSKANKVQIITDDDAEFICPECGDELQEYKEEEPPTKPNRRPLAIGGMVIVLVALIIGGYFLFFNKAKTPTAIKLDKATLTMTVGDRELIVPSVEPEDVKATFTFKANGSNIEVTNGGEVTAKKKGEATITVKCEENPEIRAICKVIVNPKEEIKEEETKEKSVPVSQLSIADGNFTLNEGESKLLSVTVYPESHNDVLTWSSDNEAIAKVDNSGNVTAVKTGSANIKISASKSGVSATVKVTVTAKKPTSTTGDRGDSGRKTGYVTNYNLGYGTYTGDMVNGQPHGHGTIIYRSQRTITGDYVASPGDKYEGDFRNGRVSGGIGYWTHNGNVKTINP